MCYIGTQTQLGLILFRKDYILLFLLIIRTTMSNIYIEKNSYNKIIRLGKDPKDFVNDAVKEKLKREKQ